MARLKIFDNATGLWVYVGGGDESPYVGPEPPIVVMDGMLWWDTDDNSILPSTLDPATLVADAAFTTALAANATYNAVLNARYAPISLGVKAYHVYSTQVNSGVSNAAADTGSTVSWTGVSGRLYKVTYCANRIVVPSGALASIVIANAANSTMFNAGIVNVVGDQGFTFIGYYTGSGAQTLKVRAASNTASPIIFQNGTWASWMIIEDIGPV